MSVYRETLKLSTSGNRDITDLTSEVARVIDASGFRDGLVNVFNVGSTGIVGTIEFEPGLKKDLPDILNKLIPASRNWGHEITWNDGNGHSHLQATLMGPEITLPFADNKLMAGTWQQIFHYEADIKPRSRSVVITVLA